MNEIHQNGFYDPLAVRKGHSQKLWERMVESAEYGVVATIVCCAVYAFLVG
jgi:hypothetical protein